jgi:hypothetical protein
MTLKAIIQSLSELKANLHKAIEGWLLAAEPS